MSKKNSLEPDIALEILKCLQGKRSSAAFSKRLGFSSNQVNRWRTGHAILTWDDLLEVCAKEKVPLRANLEKKTVLNAEPDDLKRFFLYYLPHYTNALLAKKMGVTPSAVTKWLNKKSSPPANSIFLLMRHSKISWAEFISCFLPPGKVTSDLLQEIISSAQTKRAVLLTHPGIAALIELIVNGEFSREKDNLVDKMSEVLGFKKALLEEIVADLLVGGHVAWSEEKEKYVSPLNTTEDLSSSVEYMKEALRFWSTYHLKLTENAKYERKTMAGFTMVAVPPENVDQAQRLIMNFMNQMMELSVPDKNTRVFNMTLFFSNLNIDAFGQVYADFKKD